MPNTNSSTDTIAEITCPICKHSIPGDAKKCTHCDSYLNWRKYLSLFTDVLALVALISVATTMAGAYKQFLRAKKTEFDFQVAGYIDQGGPVLDTKLYAANLGELPGMLNTAYFDVQIGKTERYAIDLDISRENDPEPWFLPANSAKGLLLTGQSKAYKWENGKKTNEMPVLDFKKLVNKALMSDTKVFCKVLVGTRTSERVGNSWFEHTRCNYVLRLDML